MNTAPVSVRVELSTILEPANRRDALAKAFRNLRPREHAVNGTTEVAIELRRARRLMARYAISASPWVPSGQHPGGDPSAAFATALEAAGVSYSARSPAKKDEKERPTARD